MKLTTLIASVSALVVSAASIPAQTASYSFFGRGCQFLSGIEWVKFDVVGVPGLGKTIRIFTKLPSQTRTVLVLTGASDKQYGNISLPFDLRRLGGGPRITWCGYLRTSIQMQVVSSRIVVFGIPVESSLLGLKFFQQVLELEASGGRLSWFISKGGKGVIGR